MFERFREASASPRFRRVTAWPSRATVASRSSFASVLSQPLTCLPISLGSKPAHDQHGEIISRLGAVGKGLHVGGKGIEHCTSVFVFFRESREQRLQARTAVALSLRILRVGCAVGDHADELTRTQSS